MEFEELEKKIEWLEKEHRKDRATISTLQQNIVEYDNALNLMKNQIKEIGNEFTQSRSAVSRIDLIDKQLNQSRTELNKTIEDVEKRRIALEKEQAERQRLESELINKSIVELRQNVDSFQDVRRGLQGRISEDARLSKELADMEKRFKDHSVAIDEINHTLRNGDEIRRSDLKKVVDLQGDLSAIRKKTEDYREKAELNYDTIQQLDHRINELLMTENERKQSQLGFIDQQNLQNIDRDKKWKEAITRVEQLSRQNLDIDQKILELEELERSIQRAKDNFDDITNRFERRINEITEIQRISEERFRQEWIGLKADDQKRWTNFTLLQDDANKTNYSQVERIIERITLLEDLYQSLKDVVDLTNDSTESHLKELMNWTHDYLSNIERITGHNKTGN